MPVNPKIEKVEHILNHAEWRGVRGNGEERHEHEENRSGENTRGRYDSETCIDTLNIVRCKEYVPMIAAQALA